jgi:hypothetical protein
MTLAGAIILLTLICGSVLLAIGVYLMACNFGEMAK